jgi:hypothetical protein
VITAAPAEQLAAIGQTVWLWSTAAAFALFLVAIFFLWGIRTRLPVRHLMLWIALIVFVPLVGPILWFALGRRRYPAKVEESFTPPPGARRLD